MCMPTGAHECGRSGGRLPAAFTAAARQQPGQRCAAAAPALCNVCSGRQAAPGCGHCPGILCQAPLCYLLHGLMHNSRFCSQKHADQVKFAWRGGSFHRCSCCQCAATASWSVSQWSVSQTWEAGACCCAGRVKRCSSKQVDLVAVGALRLDPGWHNRGYIFPEGFCSPTLFRSSGPPSIPASTPPLISAPIPCLRQRRFFY